MKTWTTRVIVDLFVLFFIHPGTRKVFISGVSANPDAAWMKRQARNATLSMKEMGHPVSHMIIDHDGKVVLHRHKIWYHRFRFHRRRAETTSPTF